MTLNGIGTMVCRASGFAHWGGPPDCDAVECFVVLYLPVIPYKALHTFEWNGEQYRFVPIEFSAALMVRGMLRHWLWAPIIIGVVLCIVALATAAGNLPAALATLAAAMSLIFVGAAGLWLLYLTDQRTRNIRYVLGPHVAGSSDPATWNRDMLGGVTTPEEMCGTRTYAAAVEKLMQQRAFSAAMWAARLAVTFEERRQGEELTDWILGDLEVQAALQDVRKNPARWQQLMNPAR
jgi:hypothetical protein